MQGSGGVWRFAGAVAACLVLALWIYGDRRLDQLGTSGGALTAALLAMMLALGALGIVCARRWQQLSGSRPSATRIRMGAAIKLLAALWVAFAIFTLAPDLLTRKDHPTVDTALVAAAWRATAWTCAVLVGYGLVRKHHP